MKLKEKLKSMLSKIGFEMDEDFIREFANLWWEEKMNVISVKCWFRNVLNVVLSKIYMKQSKVFQIDFFTYYWHSLNFVYTTL